VLIQYSGEVENV